MTTREPLLQVRDLTVRFGGLTAVNEVSFDVGEGELLGIIGPNGAGKTTTFNAIAGACRPASGTISIGTSTVSGRPPETVARLGIARTFQSVRLFRSMTVAENIALAAVAGSRSMTAVRRRAAEVVDLLGLDALRDKQVDSLPLADQKRVEIARALALTPKILLLDEMMSGLNPEETQEIIGLIRQLNDRGLTIIVIEHVIRVINELSHRVLVLDHGVLIAQGRPDEVMSDSRVIEAYLGRGGGTGDDSSTARSLRPGAGAPAGYGGGTGDDSSTARSLRPGAGAPAGYGGGTGDDSSTARSLRPGAGAPAGYGGGTGDDSSTARSGTPQDPGGARTPEEGA